ncbi:hypothetical protein J1N35_028397 [Gossypium stocksii]|uniref:Uncharacterized protein n=1 Tax=Gossypium stocksii TaxID=47602 RepID=A0A9D3UWA4_9ROSI|nr:hypothetical protein J1N35_028397 [Gossypium stocksii]
MDCLLILGLMAPTPSPDSGSVDGGCATFTGEKVVNSFPRHEVTGPYLHRRVLFNRQTELLFPTHLPFYSPSKINFSLRGCSSWSLAHFYHPFTDARTVSDVWLTAASLFIADTNAK